MRVALYQPDMPQNVGAAMRLCACMNTPLDVIEPCGFPWNRQKMQRSGMDYIDIVNLHKHESWASFKETHKGNRLVLMTTKTDQSYLDFEFQEGDILIAGQESAGVPEDVHNSVDHHITIPMAESARSMNVINATSMIVGEALRQTRS
ncbi:MAG: tRNA (cytidine(34)-2'-O)-methyltransferase [Alphaproteobacteria bacterium]|nr:tRNA (cytidine(34)-2'-O)-methyltransferase [Alphaproteobacteria bacterium]